MLLNLCLQTKINLIFRPCLYINFEFIRTIYRMFATYVIENFLICSHRTLVFVEGWRSAKGVSIALSRGVGWGLEEATGAFSV
jgi:hypothetical protein